MVRWQSVFIDFFFSSEISIVKSGSTATAEYLILILFLAWISSLNFQFKWYGYVRKPRTYHSYRWLIASVRLHTFAGLDWPNQCHLWRNHTRYPFSIQEGFRVLLSCSIRQCFSFLSLVWFKWNDMCNDLPLIMKCTCIELPIIFKKKIIISNENSFTYICLCVLGQLIETPKKNS